MRTAEESVSELPSPASAFNRNRTCDPFRVKEVRFHLRHESRMSSPVTPELLLTHRNDTKSLRGDVLAAVDHRASQPTITDHHPNGKMTPVIPGTIIFHQLWRLPADDLRADDGNRTRVSSLGRKHLATGLHPHVS